MSGFFARLREAEEILALVAEATDGMTEPARNGAAVLEALSKGDEEALRRRVQPTVDRVIRSRDALANLRERIRVFLGEGRTS